MTGKRNPWNAYPKLGLSREAGADICGAATCEVVDSGTFSCAGARTALYTVSAQGKRVPHEEQEVAIYEFAALQSGHTPRTSGRINILSLLVPPSLPSHCLRRPASIEWYRGPVVYVTRAYLRPLSRLGCACPTSATCLAPPQELPFSPEYPWGLYRGTAPQSAIGQYGSLLKPGKALFRGCRRPVPPG
jgi:hypothetical protein